MRYLFVFFAVWFVIHFLKFSFRRWRNQRSDLNLGSNAPDVSFDELMRWGGGEDIDRTFEVKQQLEQSKPKS